MSKKKEFKKIFDNMEPESTEAHVDLTKPSKADEAENTSAPHVDTVTDEVTGVSVENLSVGQMQLADERTEEISPDDLLGDVRKSLIEDEAQEGAKQPKWWKRIGRSSRRKADEAESQVAIEEINLPLSNALPVAAAKVSEETESEEYVEQLDELIDLLVTEDEPEEESPVPQEVKVNVEPEKPIDVEDLKKQAFQPRSPHDGTESLTEVRAIALEGGEEVFVEVESTRQNPLEERLDAMENALKPHQRSLNFAFAFLGIVMAITAAFLIYNAYQGSVAKQEAAEVVVSNLPFPTSVSLPGGWQFNLGKGRLTDGNWNPAGAEWLQGTEVCRWVALPYSRQLEAVIRTLNPNDPIELGMSNNDRLVYSVYSIQQMSPAEMRELDSNSPCLLIILAEPEAEKRWVLTALP